MRVLMIMFLALWGGVVCAQRLELEMETVDYGTIKLNSDGRRTVNIKNVGTAPLIIEHVQGSCSCSVAEYPKAPITSGESAQIVVQYDTKRKGPFTKAFTIRSNAENANKFGESLLYIKGVVEE